LAGRDALLTVHTPCGIQSLHLDRNRVRHIENRFDLELEQMGNLSALVIPLRTCREGQDRRPVRTSELAMSHSRAAGRRATPQRLDRKRLIREAKRIVALRARAPDGASSARAEKVMPDLVVSALIALVIGAAIGIAASLIVSRVFDEFAGRRWLAEPVYGALIGAATLVILLGLSRFAW